MNAFSLDEKIKELNKIAEAAKKEKGNYGDLFVAYNSLFFKILDVLSQMQDDGEIIAEPGKKPIAYLKEILEHDGPEYFYIICFNFRDDMKKKYEIGVCVRGWPIIKNL